MPERDWQVRTAIGTELAIAILLVRPPCAAA